MKQTAVEQFIEQLEEQGSSWENVSIGKIQISIKVEDYLELIKQAKAMEKEQIIEAYEQGYRDGETNSNTVNYGIDISKFADAKIYYKETFKSE